MKIAYYTDLHLEFRQWQPSEPLDADVIVLGGDIDIGVRGIEWAKKHFFQPVIYVAGNHEYYLQPNIQQTNMAMLKAAEGTNVHVLIDDNIVINGVNFVGSTLWSDFNLNQNQVGCMKYASTAMNDYNLIKMQTEHSTSRPFTPVDALAIHQKSLRSIDDKLIQDIPNIVMTHFGVHENCAHPQYHGDLLSGAFSTDLTEFITQNKSKITAWIYGHTHHNKDFAISGIPILTNQRGYAPYELVPEFITDKKLIVKVPNVIADIDIG